MNRLGKLSQLSSEDRRLLIQSGILMAGVRVGLWLLPFQRLRQLLTKVGPSRHNADSPNVDRVVWAVKTTSRYVPSASCLTQALAAQTLLERRGYPVELRIGVARNEEGTFQAHAWLEDRGRVLIGDLPNLTHYAPLPPLQEKRG